MKRAQAVAFECRQDFRQGPLELRTGPLDRKLSGLACALTLTSHLHLVAAQRSLVQDLDGVAAEIQGGGERNLIAGDLPFLEWYVPLRPGHAAGELLPVDLEGERRRSHIAAAPRHVPRPLP